jgi:hypothetical protein
MSEKNTCKDCNKKYSSKTKLNIHKREKHTFNNVLEKECIGSNSVCLQFYFTEEEIEELKKKLLNEEKNKEYQQEIERTVNKTLDQ